MIAEIGLQNLSVRRHFIRGRKSWRARALTDSRLSHEIKFREVLETLHPRSKMKIKHEGEGAQIYSKLAIGVLCIFLPGNDSFLSQKKSLTDMCKNSSVLYILTSIWVLRTSNAGRNLNFQNIKHALMCSQRASKAKVILLEIDSLIILFHVLKNDQADS